MLSKMKRIAVGIGIILMLYFSFVILFITIQLRPGIILEN
jgi:hypothetical protein